MTYTFNRPAFPATRMRRIRKNDQLRAMVSETQLTANHLIYPVFVLPGQQQVQDIPSMPNIQRLSADLLLKKAEQLLELGVSKLALFPVTPQEDKSLTAEAAWHEDGLVQTTCQLLKKNYLKWYSSQMVHLILIPLMVKMALSMKQAMC
jgi:porphobilinogen synthase